MANTITADCINCGACEAECPNGAISPGDDMYVIAANLCDECASAGGASACIDVCPSDAITRA